MFQVNIREEENNLEIKMFDEAGCFYVSRKRIECVDEAGLIDTIRDMLEESKKQITIDHRELLKTGVFGKTSNRGYFVIVGDKLVFENGGFLNTFNINRYLMSSGGDEIRFLCKAYSFNQAKDPYLREMIWKR